MVSCSLSQMRRLGLITIVETHTMGVSLYRYLDIKMHEAIKEQRYNQITVVDSYARCPSFRIFSSEKVDKSFNWQRPTALITGDELLIQCSPGYDHVEHNVELIATYLGLQQRFGCHLLTRLADVAFIPASCLDTQRALRASNLQELPPHIDTIVLGLVHRLNRLSGAAEWQRKECFG